MHVQGGPYGISQKQMGKVALFLVPDTFSLQICTVPLIPYGIPCTGRYMFMLQLFESLCTQGETGHALLYALQNLLQF